MARKPVRPSLGTVLDALPLGIVLTLLAALPSYFNLATDQIFEEEKSLLLRAGALVALPALITMWRPDTRRALTHPITIGFAALLAMLTIATVLAVAPHDALWGAHLRRHGLVTWVAVAVLFAAMLPAARATAGRDLLIRAVIAGAIWPSIYLLMQRGGIDPVQWIAPSEGFKAGGTFGNHVLLGGYLAIVIPLTALETYRSNRGWGVLLALELAAIAATASRGAMLALAAAIVTVAAILLWRLAPRRTGAAVTAATLLGVLLFVTVPVLRPAPVAELLDPKVGSARVRILIWQDTIDIVRHAGSRMVFGHGPDSLPAVFPAHYSPEIGYWEQIDAMPDRAHNETLDMLVSAGVIGALLQLVLFAVTFAGALRIEDVALRCALAAAIVAHVVEIQFGIASVTTRLCFMTIAAIVIGAHLPGESREPAASPWWLALAAILGAAAPWLLVLPSIINNPVSSGGEEQFVAYLRGQSAAIPVLYIAILLAALAIARALSNKNIGAPWRVLLLIASMWAATVMCIEPSRTDAFAAAGRSYEREQRWPEATIAYKSAAHDQPHASAYQSDLGRASIEWAIRAEPQMRDQLLEQGRLAFQNAVDLNPLDIEARRRLASHSRIRASFLQGAERDEALRQADQAYASVSALAPTWTPLWIEWAWVDVDRGLPNEASRKLERALALNAQHPAALSLRQQLK